MLDEQYVGSGEVERSRRPFLVLERPTPAPVADESDGDADAELLTDSDADERRRRGVSKKRDVVFVSNASAPPARVLGR